VGGLCLLLAVPHLLPLLAHFTEGIPAAYRAIPGYEAVPLVTGDHLQFYYWCWVMVDNLIGPSALFTNPYEFNTFLSAGVPNYANFPWSAVYFALYSLGPVLAYNLMMVLTYPLCGISGYLLGRQVTGSRLTGLVTGLAVAFLPLRVAGISGGHIESFVLWLAPLSMFCLERGLAKRSWLWGAAAGLCLVALCLMTTNLIYYLCLLLALYLPMRLVSAARPAPSWGGSLGDGLWPALAGLALGITFHLSLVRLGQAAFWSAGLLQGMAIHLLLALSGWLFLAWLAAIFTRLDMGQTRRLTGRALAPLVLSPLYGLIWLLPIPHLGGILLGVLGLACLGLLIRGLGPRLAWPAWPAGIWKPLIPLALGFVLVGAWMMRLKATTLDASVAQAGRGLDQVLLFSPHLGDLFSRHEGNLERLIAVNPLVLVTALAGLLLLWAARRPAGEGGGLRLGPGAAAFGFLGVTATLLSLGPGLRHAPLYTLFYKFVPFFNFPRVPGRIIMLAVVMLAVFGGWCLARLSRRLSWRAGPVLLAALVIAVAAWHAWPRGPLAVCLIPPPGPVEQRIAQELPEGPASEQRLLGLPIWPGDSHQSSIYELLISRTRALTVNGYSPVVPQAYVDQVFWPLFPLDLGLVDAPALDTLRRLKVRLVNFYDDEMVYPSKISPFPPALARQRLLASGAFRPLCLAGSAFLWEFDSSARPDADPGRVTSPVASLWEAEWLRPATGRIVEDPRASGWGLLFAGSLDPDAPLGSRQARRTGNLVQARAGQDQPGFLARGTGKYFPVGSYLARFRVRRGQDRPAGASAGWVGVSRKDDGVALGRVELTPDTLPADANWHYVCVPFQVNKIGPINLQAFFAGQADLSLDVVTVCFAEQAKPPAFYRAQDLWRQTGDLNPDPAVPGGLAVTARQGYHPCLYLMHGPQRIYPPGRYVARFRLAGQAGPDASAPAVHLVVARDLGRVTLAGRKLTAGELSTDYREYEVVFKLDQARELGFRVRYLGGADLRLAGVAIAADH
jgi:hypothetical protein